MATESPIVHPDVILAGGGINWSWYMHLDHHQDGSVTVKRYYRLHDDDSDHPTTVGSLYNTTEEADRVLVRIGWIKKELVSAAIDSEVNNPKYIFDYKPEQV